MADIGLNQNISIQDRKFHIQTATNIEDGLIKTEVFEQGRLLYAEQYKYERRTDAGDNGGEVRLRNVLSQFHKSTIANLETFFELSQILKDKDHSLSHYRLGAIFLALNIYDQAEIHLEKAILIDDKYYSAYIAFARCQFYQKNYPKAGTLLETLVKNNVNYPDLYNLLGMVKLEQKNYIHALNHFRHAIKLNPKYKEAYFNISSAIFQRISFLRSQNREDEVKRNLEFLNVVLNKIYKIGGSQDRSLVSEIKHAFTKKNFTKIQSLIFDYRNKLFYKQLAPELVGYEFYLFLRYLSDRLDYDSLQYFNEKITKTLDENIEYADMWNYLALIHLLLCRDYFLKGLNNIKEATKLNPKYIKAQNNLRLVENDGREFLSLIKAIVK